LKKICILASRADETPEGKSIVELAYSKGVNVLTPHEEGERSTFIKFSAETRSSGVDLPDGRRRSEKELMTRLKTYLKRQRINFPKK